MATTATAESFPTMRLPKETRTSCLRRSSRFPGVEVTGTDRCPYEDRANRKETEGERDSNAPGQQMVHQQVSLCPH